jgi:CheY-like chemotaxis protein
MAENPQKLLFISDDSFNDNLSSSIKHLLKLQGYQLEEVSNMKEAIQQAGRIYPQVVLTNKQPTTDKLPFQDLTNIRAELDKHGLKNVSLICIQSSSDMSSRNVRVGPHSYISYVGELDLVMSLINRLANVTMPKALAARA